MLAVTFHLAALILVALYAVTTAPTKKGKVIMIATELPMGNPNAPTHLSPGAQGKPGKPPTPKTQKKEKAEAPKSTVPEKPTEPKKNPETKAQAKNEKKQVKSSSDLKDPNAKNVKKQQEKPKNEKHTSNPGESNQVSQEEEARRKALQEINQGIANRNTTTSEGASSSQNTGAGGAGGGGGPGSEVGARDSSYVTYVAMVRNLIKRNWVRLGSESGQVLRAQINIKVDASGNVTTKAITKSSGNTSFDHSIKRAIESSSPLPPPPPAARQDAITDGIIIEFAGGSKAG